MLVEKSIGMLAILSISGVLVVGIFIVISIIFTIMRKRKRIDQNSINTIPGLMKSSVEEEEDNPKECFPDFFPADSHNKSMSSEASTKYSDSGTDTISAADQSDTTSRSVNSV